MSVVELSAAGQADGQIRTEHHMEAMDARARRAAKRVGWIARKSRWRVGTIDNWGGFMIIDPFHNSIVSGVRFDLTPAAVIDICTPEEETAGPRETTESP